MNTTHEQIYELIKKFYEKGFHFRIKKNRESTECYLLLCRFGWTEQQYIPYKTNYSHIEPAIEQHYDILCRKIKNYKVLSERES